MDLVTVFLTLGALYLAAGALFALAFVSAGISRLDPGARGASLLLRALLLPASALLWPIFLGRWLRGWTGAPVERNAHRDLAARRIQEQA